MYGKIENYSAGCIFMDVSIVIINWNTRNLVLKCIKSVIDAGSGYTREIIVVDNASTDGSAEAISKAYPDVMVVRNAVNLGFARANNIGIERSKGRYICLVNSDVEVFAETIPGMITYMEKNPGVGIVGPRILFPDRTLQNSCRKYPSLWTKLCETFALNKLIPMSEIFSGEHMSYFAHDRQKKVESIAGCFMFVRKEAITKAGAFDEQFFIYSEETDLCKRFNQEGWNIVYLPEISIIHHHGASSSKDPLRFTLEQQRSVIRYWKKHHSYSSNACLISLLFFHHAVRYLWWFISYVAAPKKRVATRQRMIRHRACINALLLLDDSNINNKSS